MRSVYSILFFLLIAETTVAQDDFVRSDTIPVEQFGNQLKHPWAGGLNAAQISTIDLDMDGMQDLFIFDREGHRWLTFINQGTSGQIDYVYAPEYERFFPSAMSNWSILRDYNCDGKKDIFTYFPGGIAVYKNISTMAGGLDFELVTDPYIYSYQPPNTLNLFVSAVDIPAIVDVDGDSDLDVLTFSVFGRTVEYHKNLSMENYGTCDSLKYEVRNLCWGGFAEGSTTNSVTLNYQGYPCTTGNVSNPEYQTEMQQFMYRGGSHDLSSSRPIEVGGGNRHSGSTVLALDMNANGVMELVLGDVSYSNMVMLTNAGTTPNTNSLMIAEDTLFPSSSVPVDITLFPAGFYEDLTNDGVPDLIACTNSVNLAEDTASVWFYENSGQSDSPTFNFVDNNEFQEDMFEVGTGAYPVLFDENSDGLLDLFIANMGHFDESCGCYKANISLYRNTGSANNPAFTFVTRDYESMSTIGLANSMHPTFGDLDNDGDQDMMVGDGDGVIHYFENIAGAGNPSDFVLSQPNYTDAANNLIDVGLFSTPFMVDLDRDSDLDLVIGERNGNLNYYENIGSPTSPSFELATDTLGGVDVRQYFDLPGGTGFSSPWFIDRNGSYELYVGAKSGYIHLYDSIENNLSGLFNQVDTMYLDYDGGKQTSPALADLTGDGYPEMIVGNYSGGLHLFMNDATPDGIREDYGKIDLVIYPNPAGDQIFVTLPPELRSEIISISIFDLHGRLIHTESIPGNASTISTQGLSDGMYILRVEGVTFYGVQRFIIKEGN